MKRILITGLSLFSLTLQLGYTQQQFTLPTSPKEEFTLQAETVVVFKFVPKKDMFFDPYKDNSVELNRLFSLVEKYRTEITAGQIPIHVNGYCASFDSKKENLRTARIRSNRVKSELITNKGLKEEAFITRNHSKAYQGNKDIVTVTLYLSPDPTQGTEEPEPEEKPQPSDYDGLSPDPTPQERANPEPIPVLQTSPTLAGSQGEVAIRTNLLYWLAAAPNLGIEWKSSDNFGILVNGLWNHWSWSDKEKLYRTWMISPEVRWYLGQRKHWFVGTEFHAGEFNLKFHETGRQGNLIGGGLTGGYKLRLSRMFDLDFSLGLGYTKFDYDTYYRSNKVMVKKETGLKKDIFGPTQAGVSLIWKIK
jgi:Protein of unknown function (DUF3575).